MEWMKNKKRNVQNEKLIDPSRFITIVYSTLYTFSKHATEWEFCNAKNMTDVRNKKPYTDLLPFIIVFVNNSLDTFTIHAKIYWRSPRKITAWLYAMLISCTGRTYTHTHNTAKVKQFRIIRLQHNFQYGEYNLHWLANINRITWHAIYHTDGTCYIFGNEKPFRGFLARVEVIRRLVWLLG